MIHGLGTGSGWRSLFETIPPGVQARTGTSLFYPPQLPDLIGVEARKYLDHTGLVYALALNLYQAAANPNRFDETAALGERVFHREGCPLCHTPPLYSNNKPTPAGLFQPPPSHQQLYEILPLRVGTDASLSIARPVRTESTDCRGSGGPDKPPGEVSCKSRPKFRPRGNDPPEREIGNPRDHFRESYDAGVALAERLQMPAGPRGRLLLVLGHGIKRSVLDGVGLLPVCPAIPIRQECRILRMRVY